MGETAFVGVDVGTGSVRAALVSCKGKILGSHVVPIKIHNPKPEFYEQSSDDIWSAVCNAVQQVATLAEKVIFYFQSGKRQFSEPILSRAKRFQVFPYLQT